MKIRNGFVSNSSSSSFIISKEKITPLQMYLIKNRKSVCEKLNLYDIVGYFSSSDDWSIHESESFVEFYTSMDNFDMIEYLRYIGISEENIIYK
ncbi:MAG TPA: hypothetical protein PLI22_02250 [Caldisericia bacterium]|nr:hypothetical protein [Caldisericia bacterium]